MFNWLKSDNKRPDFGVESERVVKADAELFGLLMNLKHCDDEMAGSIIDLVKAIGCSCALNGELHNAVLELLEAKRVDFKK